MSSAAGAGSLLDHARGELGAVATLERASQAAERALLCEELRFGATLDYLPVLDDEDFVRSPHSRQTVRDDD